MVLAGPSLFCQTLLISLLNLRNFVCLNRFDLVCDRKFRIAVLLISGNALFNRQCGRIGKFKGFWDVHWKIMLAFHRFFGFCFNNRYRLFELGFNWNVNDFLRLFHRNVRQYSLHKRNCRKIGRCSKTGLHRRSLPAWPELFFY